MPFTDRKLVKYSTDKNIGIVTLTRPEKYNAMGSEGYLDLCEAMRFADSDPNTVITVVTGQGKYFSAGADVQSAASIPNNAENNANKPSELENRSSIRRFVANNTEITYVFSNHKKILVFALNGPAIGLSAAIVAHADFIYATPDVFLLFPFVFLGLVSEGGSAYTLVQRLGLSKANEALLQSKKLTLQELEQCNFINKVFPKDDSFLPTVLSYIHEWFDNLQPDSLIQVKALIRKNITPGVTTTNTDEVVYGLRRFEEGVPQSVFSKIARGEAKHKL